MTTQRLWAAVAGLVLAVAAFVGGPAGLVGNGIPSAKAQSASSLVANVMGLLQANPPASQAKLNAAIEAAVAAGGPGLIAALVLTAGVGGGKAGNATLAQAMATALITAAKSDPAIQTAVGQGLGAAARTLAVSNPELSAIATAAANNANIATITAGFNNSSTVAVVQPSPSQSGPQCSGGSCN